MRAEVIEDSDGDTCPNCGGQVVLRDFELFCEVCGFVLGASLFLANSGTRVSHSVKDAPNVVKFYDDRFGGHSVYFSAGGGKRISREWHETYGRIRRYPVYLVKPESPRKGEVDVYFLIEKVGKELNLPQHVIEFAKKLYYRIRTGKYDGWEKLRLVKYDVKVLVVIHLSCVIHKEPVPLRTIGKVLDISTGELRLGLKLSRKIARMNGLTGAFEYYLSERYVDDIVYRTLSALGMVKYIEVVGQALHIAQEKYPSIAPRSLLGGLLYMMVKRCKAKGVRKQKLPAIKDLEAVVGVSSVSLRKWGKILDGVDEVVRLIDQVCPENCPSGRKSSMT